MDTNIDFITYHATTTDDLGAQTYIEAQYFVPFLDYYFVFTTLIFTVAVSAFIYKVFKRKNIWN